MYSVLDYGHMAAEPMRMDAYARAIARAVEPGSIVADLGSGTGMLTLLAARAGAKRVHAVDVNPAVWLAGEIAAENGLADRIVVHEGSSLDLMLPERVDVVVSDMRGSFPLHHDHLAAMHDAATRLLAPGGKLIPVRDQLMAGLVESSELWTYLSAGWTAFERLGISAKSARVATLNAAYTDFTTPLYANDLLTSSGTWLTLMYGQPAPLSLDGSVHVPVTRGGVAHAIAVWFQATILDDIGFDTGPGVSSAYARRVLPLAEPIAVEVGDVVEMTIRASTRGDRWAWDTAVTAPSGNVKCSLRQSTFLGMPTSPASLLRRSSAFQPSLSPRGERAARILALMDGTRTIAEIAAGAAGAVTDGQPSTAGAAADLEQVRELVSLYAR